MNYLPILTQDEIQYICSVIPHYDTEKYFKRYPKDFAKIMPGFRAISLKNQEQISGILFRNRNHYFISSFIEKHISRWLIEIETAINEKIVEGKSKETALLQTFPHCFFADNIRLYFKLTGEEYAEDYLAILSSGIKLIKDFDADRDKLEKRLKDKSSESNCALAELELAKIQLDKITKRYHDKLNEISALKRTDADVESLKEFISVQEQSNEVLKLKILELENNKQRLYDELSTERDERHQLEQKICEEIKKQQILEYVRQEASKIPKCPKDLDEFKDYFGYNIEDIGVSSNSDYYVLLKEHVSEILFQGKPILVTRDTGFSLMKCVSNTLVKTPTVPTLAFASDITDKEIESFLSQDGRIVCLDNFIGNYNETTLITICENHKDKIIFLTVMFDRTLCFVPEELMKYCHYLNLNRIEAFIGDKELTEDPSFLDETETFYSTNISDSRWSKFFKNLLDDFGVCSSLSIYKSSLVIDELSLCRSLVFDILPYCVDVLKIAPFNVSADLVKYAGDRGRCSYKDLLRKWFS